MRISRENYLVLSVPWTIREVPAGSAEIDDCCGKTDFNGYQIFIAEMPVEEQIETLLHETLHIITRGRTSCDLTKEDELRVLSMILADTLIRNKLSFALDDERGW